AEQQHVVERLAALPRGRDEDFELRFDARLADILGELARAHGTVERLVVLARGRRHHAAFVDTIELAHRSTARSRWTRRSASRMSCSVLSSTLSRSLSIFATSAGL